MTKLDRSTWLVIAVTVLAIAGPLFAATYPPITDLPFHAAAISILRHLHEPAFHFEEQLTTQFAAVPYSTFYLLGAALAWVLPIALATKLAAAILLAFLPAGLAILLQALRRDPRLAVLSVPLAWTTLTHWGFVAYVAAVGLAAASLGCALLVVEEATPRRRVALALALLVTLETHVARYPSAACAVLATCFVGGSPLRNAIAFAPSLLPSALRFAGWLAFGAHHGSPKLSPPDLRRVASFGASFADGFIGPFRSAERAAWCSSLVTLVVLAAASFVLRRRESPVDPPPTSVDPRRARAVVLCVVLGSFALYLTLPMSVDGWWFVYPREAVVAAYFALALLPSLPRAPRPRSRLLLAACVPAIAVSAVVYRAYATFEDESADFRRIVQAVPEAPRLAYLVFDHGGSYRRDSPFVHLPAWVQAEKGGWLSFHFASGGDSPIRYRSDSADIPPTMLPHAEWDPNRFDVETTGAFFDTFLVRRPSSPDALFAFDPHIKLLQHSGTWWLYRRVP